MRVIRLAIVFVFSTALLWAQATSQIQGIVQDTSGAVIPGIEVKATQTDTGISRMAISSEDGRYVLPNLPIGPYRLEVSAPGFSPFVQTGIVLQVASIPTVNITLKPGAIAETVQVEANAGLVETQTTSIGKWLPMPAPPARTFIAKNRCPIPWRMDSPWSKRLKRQIASSRSAARGSVPSSMLKRRKFMTLEDSVTYS